METLKEYYIEQFQKKFPADEHPDFEKLDPEMIKKLEQSTGFGAYKMNKALKQFNEAFGISADQFKIAALKFAKAFRKLPTKMKRRY